MCVIFMRYLGPPSPYLGFGWKMWSILIQKWAILMINVVDDDDSHKIPLIYPTPPPIWKLCEILMQKRDKNDHKTPMLAPPIVKSREIGTFW